MIFPMTCDVAVVGGGPAGSTAAYLLACKGYEVCLIDKQAFPRSKLCAGLLTWKTIALLQQIYPTSLDELCENDIISHHCSDYRIYRRHTEIVRGRLDFPFHFVDRRTYDFHWLQTAEKAGVHVETGTAAIKIDPSRSHIYLADGRCIRARFIIGADGVHSPVRKTLWPHNTRNFHWKNNLALAIETRWSANSSRPWPRYASLHFGYVPWGYAWSFPHPNGRILGMGSLTHKDRRPARRAFANFLGSLAVDEDDVDPLQAYPLPYGNYLASPAKGKVVLIGDACGLADPLLGEGIYYAHRSAQLAADAIVASGPDLNQVDRRYCHALKRHLIRELRWIKFYRNILYMGGGHYRRYRGLKLFFRWIPKRMEAAIQGRRSFGQLLLP